jgi:hypothetical protein
LQGPTFKCASNLVATLNLQPRKLGLFKKRSPVTCKFKVLPFMGTNFKLQVTFKVALPRDTLFKKRGHGSNMAKNERSFLKSMALS